MILLAVALSKHVIFRGETMHDWNIDNVNEEEYLNHLT